jgi:hypothetical protein
VGGVVIVCFVFVIKNTVMFVGLKFLFVFVGGG